MNKSIVLVMCDVLVLSSMSLSTGGFEQVESTGLSSDHSISIEEYTNLVYTATKAANTVSNLNEKLSMEIMKREQAESNAVNTATKAANTVSNLNEKLSMEIMKREQAESNAVNTATKAANAVSNLNEKLGIEIMKREQAESNAVYTATKAANTVSNLNEKLGIAIMKREQAESNAVNTATKAANAVSNLNEKLSMEIMKREQAESNAVNTATKAANTVSNLNEKLGIEILKREQAESNLVSQIKDTEEKVRRIKTYYDDSYGFGVKRRQELINNDVYGVFIKYKKDDNQLLYSPIIQIESEKFAIAYLKRKLIKYISRIDILRESKSFASVDSIYGIDQHEELLFLKLRSCDLLDNEVLSIGADSVQNDNPFSDDRYYWFRTKSGEVKKIRWSATDLKEWWEASKDIENGDLMISENLAKIVRIAVPKFIKLKDDLRLNDIKKDDLKHLRDL